MVWRMVEATVLQPTKLKKCLASAGARVRSVQLRMEKGLRALYEREKHLKEERHAVLDHYATGKLEHDKYVDQSLWFDNESNKLKLERAELVKRIPILHSKDVIDVSLRIFCETVKARFEKCTNFETKRQFLLDFIEEVIYGHGKITVKGFVPIQRNVTPDSDQAEENNMIEFNVEDDSHKKELPQNAIKPILEFNLLSRKRPK